MFLPLPYSDLDHVITHTRRLWAEMRGARIFVTGGTGFFGRWLLESFIHANLQLQLGATLVCLTRSREAFRVQAPHVVASPSIELCEGDVRSFELPPGDFTHVIHAATTAAHAVDPLDNIDTIIEGTRRVLDFAVNRKIRSFLLTSSGAVYGRQPPDLIRVPETYAGAPDPLDPASAYGEGKRAAELLCAIYFRKYGVPVKIARCFAFAGPLLPLDTHFAIGNFVRNALAGDPVTVKSDGTAMRSYLYAADLAIWLWTILVHGTPCRPYNVGSGDYLSIGELARTVAAVLQSDAPVRIQYEPTGAPPARYVPDVERARNELGLDVQVGLQESIRRTAAFVIAS